MLDGRPLRTENSQFSKLLKSTIIIQLVIFSLLNIVLQMLFLPGKRKMTPDSSPKPKKQGNLIKGYSSINFDFQYKLLSGCAENDSMLFSNLNRSGDGKLFCKASQLSVLSVRGPTSLSQSCGWFSVWKTINDFGLSFPEEIRSLLR